MPKPAVLREMTSDNLIELSNKIVNTTATMQYNVETYGNNNPSNITVFRTFLSVVIYHKFPCKVCSLLIKKQANCEICVIITLSRQFYRYPKPLFISNIYYRNNHVDYRSFPKSSTVYAPGKFWCKKWKRSAMQIMYLIEEISQLYEFELCIPPPGQN